MFCVFDSYDGKFTIQYNYDVQMFSAVILSVEILDVGVQHCEM
jgi:hypothetical protein